MGTQKKLKFIIFLLALALFAVGAYAYSLSKKNADEALYESQPAAIIDSQEETAPIENGAKMEDGTAASTSPQEKPKPDAQALCVADLNQKLSRDKVDYEKGRILVGFDKETSLEEATAIIKKNNYGYTSNSATEEAYASAHLLTVTVPVGREVSVVCSLKNVEHVRYTNVNAYFFLHD